MASWRVERLCLSQEARCDFDVAELTTGPQQALVLAKKKIL